MSKITYEELGTLIYSGDVLASSDHPDRVSITEAGLVILGYFNSDEGEAPDLKIRIDGSLFYLSFRDPAECPDDDTFYGRDWTEECACSSYTELVSTVYSS